MTLHRSALQRGLRQLAEGQAARQAPADPERRPRRRLRGVPARRLRQHPERDQGRVYVCMSSSELHTLQRAFTAAGGKWSTFVIWAKNTFTLGRADYQRQYEPILYGWQDGHDHYWCGARDQGDVWFFDKPAQERPASDHEAGGAGRAGDPQLEQDAATSCSTRSAARARP